MFVHECLIKDVEKSLKSKYLTQGYIYCQIRDIMGGGKKSGILKRGKKNQGEKYKRKGKNLIV